MSGVQVGTLDVDRHKVDLFFDGNKLFYADVLQERMESKSLDSLKDRVRDRLRAGDLKLAIPATLLEYDDDKGASGVKCSDVELVGTHGRTGRVLYKEGGRTDEFRGWSNSKLTKCLTAAQRQRARDLRQAIKVALEKWDEWLERVELANDGRTIVEAEKALRIAAKQPAVQK